MCDLADLVVDAVCALGCTAVVGLLVAAASELAGFWRDLLVKGVGW